MGLDERMKDCNKILDGIYSHGDMFKMVLIHRTLSENSGETICTLDGDIRDLERAMYEMMQKDDLFFQMVLIAIITSVKTNKRQKRIYVDFINKANEMAIKKNI